MRRAKKVFWTLAAVLLVLTFVSCQKKPELSAAELAAVEITQPVRLPEAPADENPELPAPAAELPEETLPQETLSQDTLPKETIPQAKAAAPQQPPRVNTTASHSHKWSSSVTKPTCTADGYTTHSCVCGHSYVDDRVSATGHSWGDWKVTKAATEAAAGTKERSCTSCNAVETGVIPQLEHTHQYTSVTKQPSCTIAGYTTYKCACGDSYRDTGAPATGHSWTAWKTTQESTEASAGTKEHTCATRGKVETVEIPRLSHTHRYTAAVTQPTCTADGYTTHTCACGHSYVDSAVASTGHSYTHTVTKPTCAAEGYTTHKCSICQTSYVDTRVPAKSHSWGEWTTVTTPTENAAGAAMRRCNTCGGTETKTLDRLAHTHNFAITIAYQPATCRSEGYQTKACSCGETRSEALPKEHNWVHKHIDEKGHYDGKIVCHCGGWSCAPTDDYVRSFTAHVNSVDPATRYDHSYYETYKWVVDVPAKDWEECTSCGAIR